MLAQPTYTVLLNFGVHQVASIENKSNYEVTVKNRADLTKAFSHTAKLAAEEYCRSLESQKFKPRLSRLDNSFIVRDRSISRKVQTITASSLIEAQDIKNRLESEHRRSIFTDYAAGYQTTFADLLVRYLWEEAPRQKSFEVVAYKINAMLEDAGLERQDLHAVIAAHPAPHKKVLDMKLRKSMSKRMGQTCEATKFIRKPFAQVVPVDFAEYCNERCQIVAPATVDREFDIFSSMCNIAIDTWRIHVEKNPMDGVRRPTYYNERNRRLAEDEEIKLIQAARAEDRKTAIRKRLEELMAKERADANDANTVYQRKKIVKTARALYLKEAKATCHHIPYFETFVLFQIMTGARRTESLTLEWANLSLEKQTAFLPETKNGRPRELSIREDLVKLLILLPRDSELVFPFGATLLRKTWERICEVAGFTGKHELCIHDLRHEAISRVAEAGSFLPGGFSLVDLQHFSGHRDTRMLLRYAHLCTTSLAKRLDEAFAARDEVIYHRGRRRLSSTASIKMSDLTRGMDIISAPGDNPGSLPGLDNIANIARAHGSVSDEMALGSIVTDSGVQSNVIRVSFGRKVA